MSGAQLLELAARPEVADCRLPQILEAASRRSLALWFKEWGFRRGVEIGVWSGHFTEILCLANPEGTVIGVDPWRAMDGYVDRKNDDGRLAQAFEEAKLKLARYRCELWRMSSLEAAERVPDGSLDWVYIDGNHAKPYVLTDLSVWSPKVRRGGVVAGHDYEIARRSSWIQVKDAVDDFRAGLPVPPPLFVLAKDKSPSFFWMVP